MNKIPVGILGATGMVGQQYIALLEGHPWFEVRYLAASPRSAGKQYSDAVFGRWHATGNAAGFSGFSDAVGKLIVQDANDVAKAEAAHKKGDLAFVFSAVALSKDETAKLECDYAAAGIPVVSNNSAHRSDPDVPMLIPEINAAHTGIIPSQQKNHGWDKGFIVVKPNCSIQSYMIPVYALMKAGYAIDKMFITTMQAVSGAGYPGLSSLDLIDNIIPHLAGEEEKSEKEPLKIFGSIEGGEIVSAKKPVISAHCNRVPVVDGHSACVSLQFATGAGSVGTAKPSLEEIASIWRNFKSLPQELQLPMAPEHPIILRKEADRPQPRLDRNNDKAMAVTVGALRPCNLFDIRFTGLSHNTVRGAAGGGILNAELLKAQGFIN
ncbi:MAG: aspartate-semialdehyde dehydrogenase [Spirochaetaceae bacterium]|jgi:aspartate-semialdehyde dehydrogenase|nr:aspartate-semialdehyde dehydrogenase [Spirochaetaceae bacterium]